jgi:hypothetical protein
MKHNKYKNSGILFELLVRQVSNDIISNKESAAINLVKKYFYKTELIKEYKLYQTLINSKELSESKADMLINTTLDASTRLNRSKLRSEKYNLINEIKANYDLEEFFKSKINNYVQYASIYNLIEIKNTKNFIDPTKIISNKITLLEHITHKEVNKDNVEDTIMEEYAGMDKGTRLLIYRNLLEKFNSKYSTLNTQQKSILKEYINNISNVVKLREFLNSNFDKVKIQLQSLNKRVTDQTTKIKINEVINLIKPLDKTQNIKDENLISLLQYHQLISELQEIR